MKTMTATVASKEFGRFIDAAQREPVSAAIMFPLSWMLGERGIAASSMREGRKPGTLVATLKSHNLGIPTLLIQPATATA